MTKESVLLLTLLLAVRLNSEEIECIHGRANDDEECVCERNYYGKFCETRYNCNNTGNPNKGQACDSCLPHWSGDFCDIIDCGEHGKRSIRVPQTCMCDPPFSGQFCTALNTSDVYRFYNQRVTRYIPFGILVIIPALILILFCNYWSRQRNEQRIQKIVKTAYLDEDDPDTLESARLSSPGVPNGN